MDPDQINFIWIRICAILSGSESFVPLGLPDVQFSMALLTLSNLSSSTHSPLLDLDPCLFMDSNLVIFVDSNLSNFYGSESK